MLHIKFSTPRHLKKVLNKYKILKDFKNLPSIPERFKKLIPNIINDTATGNLFETIFCLFMIVLYEYNSDHFKDIEDYEHKMIGYVDIVYNTRLKTTGNTNYNKTQASDEVRRQLYISKIKNATLQDIILSSQSILGHPHGKSKFIFIFSDSKPNSLTYLFDHDLYKFNEYFSDDSITTNFCKFLMKYIDDIIKEGESSDYVIWNLFDMVKYLL